MVLIISPLSATENEESEISDEEDDDVSEEEMPSVKPAKKKQI